MSERLRKHIIPEHLKAYIVEQNYEKYTPRDHALWRFIMQNSKDFLGKHAHASFLEGLELTGIPTDRIPNINEMNEQLSHFGWNAVCVCGFIPPLAFLEFQSNRILPIAADMRSVEHFDYTPAPDIVHEALGHAPILADEAYRNYLVKYAVLARRAIFSDEDVRLYEAIRFLSDVKENPDSTSALIEEAEQRLKKTQEAISWVSEAAKITRMYWWTVEYGLVGTVEKPKIYGAGLLSSLGESLDCLKPEVRKIAFDLNCMSTSYDITEPQPQLFVARNFEELSEALDLVEAEIAYSKGGKLGLDLAKKAKSVCTVQLNTGLQVSGLLTESLFEQDQPVFLKWSGPVQLCIKGLPLKGHGTSYHQEGFSCPLGSWQGVKKQPALLTDQDLESLGLKQGKKTHIRFVSGFELEGVLKSLVRAEDGSLLLLSFSACTVRKDAKLYFQAEWGDFDLAIGSTVPSVFGGPADWKTYIAGNFGRASSQPGRTSPYTEQEKHLFSLYSHVRTLRESSSSPEQALHTWEEIARELLSDYEKEWLLALELLEVRKELKLKTSTDAFAYLSEEVLRLDKYHPNQSRFMKMALDRILGNSAVK